MISAELVADKLAQYQAGQVRALGELFELFKDRLWRMVRVRLDRRLAGRIDPDDVLQEAFLDVSRRISEFLEQSEVPFYVWLRFLTLQRMAMLQRTHMGAQMRSVAMEVSASAPAFSPANTESLAGQFLGHMTSPSQAAIRQELQDQLRAALEEMEPLDREVLALRHFEELSNSEVAQVLQISKEAASKRHLRALKRLQEFFQQHSEE